MKKKNTKIDQKYLNSIRFSDFHALIETIKCNDNNNNNYYYVIDAFKNYSVY